MLEVAGLEARTSRNVILNKGPRVKKEFIKYLRMIIQKLLLLDTYVHC